MPSAKTQRLTIPSSVSSTVASQSHKRHHTHPQERDKPEKRVLDVREQGRLRGWEDEFGLSEGVGKDEKEMIVESLVDEFPLLDEPLIRAIINDHPIDDLYSKLDSIRDDLAMLQATVVPDHEIEQEVVPPVTDEAESSMSLASMGAGEGSSSAVPSSEKGKGKGAEKSGSNGSRSGSSAGSRQTVSSKSSKKGVKKHDFVEEEIEEKAADRTRTETGTPTPQVEKLGPGLIPFAALTKPLPSSTQPSTSSLNSLAQSNSKSKSLPNSATPSSRSSEVVAVPGDFSDDGEAEVAPGYDDGVGFDSEMWLKDNGGVGDQGGEYDPGMFLREMFDNLPDSVIEKAIEEFSLRSGGDMSLAIENLLSSEAIRETQERGSWKTENGNEDGTDTDGTEDERAGDVPTIDDWLAFTPPVSRTATPRANVNESRTTDEEGDEKRVVIPSRPKAKKRKTKSPPRGPRPNDHPTLPLQTQMYTRMRNRVPLPPLVPGSPVASDSEAGPSTKKSKPLPPVGRFAALALQADTYAGFSSGDESAGSVKSAESAGKTPVRAIPLRKFEKREKDKKARAVPLPGPGTPLLEKETDDAEGTKVSLATYLAEITKSRKADAEYFLVFFRSKAYTTAYAALYDSLKGIRFPAERVRSEMDMVKEIKAEVEVGSIMATPRDEIELAVRVTRDVSLSLDLLALLEEVRNWGNTIESAWPNLVYELEQGYDNGVGSRPAASDAAPVLVIDGQREFPPEPQIPKRRKGVKTGQHVQNWRTVRGRNDQVKEAPTVRLGDFIPKYTQRGYNNGDHLYDLDECRRKAIEERAKREAAVRQAGRHFRAGNAGRGRQVAAYYASEARRYEEAARAWEVRAARELVSQQSSTRSGNSIDLHGLTLDEARAVALERVEMHFATGSNMAFQIVVGKGNHSKGNAILGPGVSNALERSGWKVHRGDGYLVVRGARDN